MGNHNNRVTCSIEILCFLAVSETEPEVSEKNESQWGSLSSPDMGGYLFIYPALEWGLSFDYLNTQKVKTTAVKSGEVPGSDPQPVSQPHT